MAKEVKIEVGLAESFKTWLDPLIFYTLLLLSRAFLWFIDLILDTISWTTISYGTRRERMKANICYEHSAQRVKIIARANWSMASKNQPRNYLTKHIEYIHPNYVLQHDNITLQGVTDTHAFFCVTNKDVNVYDPTVIPFVFVSQFLLAEELVIMPLKSFVRLSEEMPGEMCDSVFVSNSARCGSTMLCQMFHKVTNTVVMSEPHTVTHLHGAFNRGLLEENEYRTLTKAAIRLQLKPFVDKEVARVILKMPLFATPAFRMMKELFPQSKLMFITRAPKPSIRSCFKCLKDMPYSSIYSRVYEKFWSEHLPFPYDDSNLQSIMQGLINGGFLVTNTVDNISRSFAGCIACYRRDRHIYDKVIFYEELTSLSSQESEVEDIFGILGIDRSEMSNALGSLKTHSQGKTFATKFMALNWDVTQEDWERTDRIFKDIGPLDCKSQDCFADFKKAVLK